MSRCEGSPGRNAPTARIAASLPFVRQKFPCTLGFVSPVYFALAVRRELGSLRGLYSATTITSLRRSIERC